MVSVIRDFFKHTEHQVAAAMLGVTVGVGLLSRRTFTEHVGLAALFVPVGYFAGKGIDYLLSSSESPVEAPSQGKKGAKVAIHVTPKAPRVESSPRRAPAAAEAVIEEPSFFKTAVETVGRTIVQWKPAFTKRRVVLGAGALGALTIASIPCFKFGLGRTIGTVGFVTGGIFLGIEGTRRTYVFLKSLVSQRSVQYVGAGASVVGGAVAMTTNSIKWALLASTLTTIGGFVLRYKLGAGPVAPAAEPVRASTPRPATPVPPARPSTPPAATTSSSSSSPTKVPAAVANHSSPAVRGKGRTPPPVTTTTVATSMTPAPAAAVMLPASAPATANGAGSPPPPTTPKKPKGSGPESEALPPSPPSTALRRSNSFTGTSGRPGGLFTGSTGSVATPLPPPSSHPAFPPSPSPEGLARAIITGVKQSALLGGHPTPAFPSSSSEARGSSPARPEPAVPSFVPAHPASVPHPSQQPEKPATPGRLGGLLSRWNGGRSSSPQGAATGSTNPFEATRSLPRTPAGTAGGSQAATSSTSSSSPVMTSTGTPITPAGGPLSPSNGRCDTMAPQPPRSSIFGGFIGRTPPLTKK